MNTTADDLFLRQVNDAMAVTDGSELAARITALHHQAVLTEIDRMKQDVQEARDQAAQTASSAALQWHHNAPLLEMLQHMIRRRGEAAARASHVGGLLDEVAKLCARAEDNGGMVPAGRLRELVARQGQPLEWSPSILSFAPSQHYRLGYFKTEDGAVVRALPFVGFAMCEEDPNHVPLTESAFLVDGQVKARPQLRVEFGLVLTHLE